MKKKFDFSAEMAEAEAIKSNPKNESLDCLLYTSDAADD